MQQNPLSGIPSFDSFTMNEEEFDAAVQSAIDQIPAQVHAAMENVTFFTADDYVPGPDEDPATVLLGLYEGTPLTERDSWWESGSLPDRITIFREPTLQMCSSREEVLEEITVTLMHEIAHHFGIGEERLHELGWG